MILMALFEWKHDKNHKELKELKYTNDNYI